MEHLQPVIEMVNNTLEIFEKGLASDIDSDKRYKRKSSCEKLELLEILSNSGPNSTQIVYDAEKYDSKYLISKLEKFSQVRFGFHQGHLEDFIKLLGYLAVFEKGGLASINKKLTQLFEELKTPDLVEEKMNKLICELNYMLYNAIYLFPHLARGIEVILKPGTEGKADYWWEQYGYDYGKERTSFDRFFKSYQEKFQIKPEKLFIPLPYYFTTGTHGSGERAAAGASREEIEFDLMPVHKHDWRKMLPTLEIAIECPLISYHRTNFLLDEIVSIQFSSKTEDFTPYEAKDFRDNVDGFLYRANYIFYYLCFRDFARYCNFRVWETVSGFSEEEQKKCQNLLEPKFDSKLWLVDWSLLFDRRKLQYGFLIAMNDNPEEIAMYELSDLKLPNKDNNISAYLFYRKILRGDKKFLKKVKVYRGDEIIKRLLEIPVAPRNF